MIARYLLLGLIGANAVWAGEVLDISVQRDLQRYAVDIDARINAPVESIRVLLTDYPHLSRINDSIHRSEVLERISPQQHKVRIEARVCVGIFCKDLVQVQAVSQLPDGSIFANIIAEESDFRYGIARWQFWPESNRTRMRFHSEIEPAFWVPPIIGPWLIQRALQAETLKSVANLERLAEMAVDVGHP